MSAHGNDTVRSFDEIEVHAAASADFWLSESINTIKRQRIAAKTEGETILGFMVSCAINYHAERFIDGAALIATAVGDLAAAIRESKVRAGDQS